MRKSHCTCCLGISYWLARVCCGREPVIYWCVKVLVPAVWAAVNLRLSHRVVWIDQCARWVYRCMPVGCISLSKGFTQSLGSLQFHCLRVYTSEDRLIIGPLLLRNSVLSFLYKLLVVCTKRTSNVSAHELLAIILVRLQIIHDSCFLVSTHLGPGSTGS